jgi:predicted ATPase/DNA-binding SARP family transcriptional activator
VGCEVEILGSLRVVVGDADVTPPAPKSRSLVALLAVNPGEVVSSDRLIDELWPDLDIERARRVLWVRMAELRASLRRAGAGDIVISASPGYRLALAPDGLDSARFAALVRDATAARAGGQHGAAAEALRTALGLWRGPALLDAQGCLALEAEAARLTDARLDAAEAWLEAELCCGRHADVLAEARRLVLEHPLREHLTCLLARCLVEVGRTADALTACRALRDRLSTELGVEPGPEVDRLEGALAEARTSSLRGRRPPDNLPFDLTGFIGRAVELDEVAALQDGHRLITLTGVGGVGKTRLALAAAAARRHRHRDGTWLVELAPLHDVDAVPAAVAGTFGVVADGAADAVTDRLAEHVADRELAIVLDNAEHVVSGAGRLVQRLLSRCPRLSVLSTSRSPLHVPGEVVYTVPPMAVAASAGRPADAVALFLQRAAAARPASPLSDVERLAADQVCRRLDGIPLAIELAAARVRMLSVDQIAARLDDCLPVLTGSSACGSPDRHSTMRAALDWSHDLLSIDERAALRRLAVFPGTFDIEGAIGVIAGTGPLGEAGADAFSLVAELVDRSLIAVVGGGTRYRLLTPVRQYAAERLDAAGETALARRAHRDAYLTRRDAMWPLTTAQQRRRLYADRQNLQAALEWSWEVGDMGAALELAMVQAVTWMMPSNATAKTWLERLLAEPGTAQHPARMRAVVELAMTLGDSGEGATGHFDDLLAEALALAARLDDPKELAACKLSCAEMFIARHDLPRARAFTLEAMHVYELEAAAAGVGWCQHYLGWLELALGDVASARAHFDLSVQLARDDPGGGWLLPHALAALAPVLALLGSGEQARRTAAEAVDAARPFEARAVLAMALCRAAEAGLIVGDDEAASADLVELLHLLRELGTRRWLGDAVEMAAVLLTRRDRPEVAAFAIGAAETLRSAAGEPEGGVRAVADEVRRSADALVVALGRDAFEKARAGGRLVPPEAAIVRLLSALEEPTTSL